jgi:F-type H+-transporting ATPase subunit delta
MKPNAHRLAAGLHELTEGMDEARAEAAVSRFVGLLKERGRLQLGPDILEAFEARAKAAAGVATVEVAVASGLPEASARRLRAGLVETIGREVDLRLKIEPELIGGAIIRFNDRRLDASVRGRLERLRRSLTA